MENGREKWKGWRRKKRMEGEGERGDEGKRVGRRLVGWEEGGEGGLVG